LVTANQNKTVLITDLLIILLGIGGLYLAHLKAGLPFKLTNSNSFLIIEHVQDSKAIFAIGDTVTSIDGYKFDYWEEVELYLDGKNIDDYVRVNISKSGIDYSSQVRLVKYYSIPELLVTAVVGFLFIGMAFFLRFKAPGNKSALVFYWAGSGLGLVILMSAGNYTALLFGYVYINRIIWLIAYSFIPVLFIRFVFTFIKKTTPYFKPIIIFLYSISFINAGILSYLFLDYAIGNNFTSLKNYVYFFDSYFRLYLTASVLAAILLCVYAFKKAVSIEERKKIRWLLLGFFGGPFIYIFFWTIPMYIYGKSPIPEILSLIVLTAIPITFTIAIIRYHFMDINLIIRRSVVYSTILVGIVLIYIGLSAFATQIIHEDNPAIVSIVTAVLVALLLQPVKTGIQKFVDKRFFRLEYDYQEEQKKFLEDIKNTNSIVVLARKIVTQADKLIPVSRIGFFIVYLDTDYDNESYNSEIKLRKPAKRLSILAHKGFEILVGRSLRFEEENLKTDLSYPVAVDDKVESGVEIESADLGVFKRWGIVLILPIKSASGEFHAFLVVGDKKAGVRFFKEDIDLLNTVCATAALTIERIKLQEELIIEQLETERLDELNKLKSYFVSSVSHELKTPLTSIKMFAELLKEKSNSKKSQEYLEIIDGESDRLRRLIDNVLDFAKIEKGLQTYDMSLIELNQLAIDVLKMMEYQFKMAKVELINNIGNGEYRIHADKGAVEEAMINILSNAIKYSDQKTKVIVSTNIGDGFVNYKVEDEGIGISKKDLDEIYNPFFRSQSDSYAKAEGAGLGLAIVKHIIDAHKGKIIVESELGKGSSFTLQFPIESSNKT
jgi:signal transduction histidine kinase